MSQSKAHIKASNKYNKEHYAKFQANISKETFGVACAHCYLSGDSKAQLISKAVNEYIERELANGKYTEEQLRTAMEEMNKKITPPEETE